MWAYSQHSLPSVWVRYKSLFSLLHPAENKRVFSFFKNKLLWTGEGRHTPNRLLDRSATPGMLWFGRLNQCVCKCIHHKPWLLQSCTLCGTWNTRTHTPVPRFLLIVCFCQLNKAYSAKDCWNTALCFWSWKIDLKIMQGMATENHAVLLNPQWIMSGNDYFTLYNEQAGNFSLCLYFILEMLHCVCGKCDVLDFVRLVSGSASFIGFRTTFPVKETYFLL